MTSLYSPSLSEKNAIDLPSGDHAGNLSCTETLFVIFLGSPFFAGIVTISPLYPKTARAPLGEISADRINRGLLLYLALISFRSVLILILTGSDKLFEKLNLITLPACS